MNKKFRRIMLTVALLATMFGQYRLSAQSDSFFYIADDFDESYDVYGLGGSGLKDDADNMGGMMVFGEGIVQDNETQEQLPLGSGLPIFLAVGAGYAFLKKKNNTVK